MSETKNDELGASGEAIDYSRPVGWWCPVCDAPVLVFHGDWCLPPIPVYLPIPEGQRPLVEDEVSEAEVVTFTSLTTGRFRISGIDIEIGHDGNARGSWSDEGELILDPDSVINWCVEQSARARIVTGATE